MEENKASVPLSNEPEIVFNAVSDQRIFGVRSEENNEMIFEISGYGLQIRFNRDRLQTVEDIESTLEGIKDMFRQLIMADLLSPNNGSESNGNAQ